MRKIFFHFAFSAMLLALCQSAGAQQPAKIPRIGVLVPGKPPTRPSLEGFRQGLRDLGYIEGQNIILELRWNDEENPERWAQLAGEVVRLKPDVILAGHSGASIGAKKATATIPIVMAAVGTDPVELGLVASLARPSGNVTGMAFLGQELNSKRLELLTEAVRPAKRVAVLWLPLTAVGAITLKDTEKTARSLGIELQSLKVQTGDDLDKAFQAATRAKARAVLITQGGLFATYRAQTAELALKSRLPTIGGEAGFVEAGGLMFYGANIPEAWRRAAHYVDRILKGAKAADLPVQIPTKFELRINLRTAKALGLTIPRSLLLRADQIIE